jgi:hypothetical protein
MARNQGKAVITATYRYKKYKCTVTVKGKKTTSTSAPKATTKAKATATPSASAPVTSSPSASVVPTQEAPVSTILPEVSTAAAVTETPEEPVTSPEASSVPEETSAPIEPEDPATTGAITTPNPDYEADELAQNVALDWQKTNAGIAITLTNNNEEWLSQLTIDFDLVSSKKYYITSGETTIYNLRPGEKRSVLFAIEESEDLSRIALSKSYSYLYVEQNDTYGKYYDMTNQITYTKGDIDEEFSIFSVTFENTGEETADVSYFISYYDSNDRLLGASYDVLSLNGSDSYEVVVEFPTETDEETDEIISTASYYDVSFSASRFEEIDRLEELAAGLSVSKLETAGKYILVSVTNNNDVWVSDVSVDYSFNDSQGNSLSTNSCSFDTIAPGKTNTALMESDTDTVSSLDENKSQATITVNEDNSDFCTYTTRKVSTSVTKSEDTDYDITFKNSSNYDVEGTYIIYYYNTSGELVEAATDTFSLSASDSDSITVTAPYDYDDDGNIVAQSKAPQITITSAYSIDYID